MVKCAKILWIDLEMTGLDPIEDRILEVAAIATDWDFSEIAVYEAAVKVGPRLVERRMKVSQDFWDKNPEVRDALIARNNTVARNGRTIENELLAFCEAHFSKGEKIILAGNSIHQDRKFIENEWTRLNQLLHYRMLDVSAWKLVFDGKFKKRFPKPEEHRALGDIRGSIMELAYYTKKVRAK